MTWPLCTFLPPTHNNKHCSTQGGGRWQKIWVYQRPNCFKEGPVHKKLAWISSQILFFKLEKGCGFLTLFFCLAHFSYLVSDITVLQTRFSPLPIGVHRKKKYPHNRWAPRTWRGGALECLTLPPRRDGRTWGLTTRYFQQHAWHCQSPSQCQQPCQELEHRCWHAISWQSRLSRQHSYNNHSTQDYCIIPSPTIDSITNNNIGGASQPQQQYSYKGITMLGCILLFERQTNLPLPWRPCSRGWSASAKGLEWQPASECLFGQ